MGASNKRGYGNVKVKPPWPQTTRIHRFIYTVVYGDPGPDFVVDHQCHNDDLECEGGDTCLHRRCWNIDHLRVKTYAENVKDVATRGRHQGKRTHCVNGHEYTPANTSLTSGHRKCRTCHRADDRRWAAKWR